jgi:hypothetical protein
VDAAGVEAPVALVLAAWAAVFLVALVASSRLSALLTNRFTLPGTDTERAEQILQNHFGQRSTGSFTLVSRMREE